MKRSLQIGSKYKPFSTVSRMSLDKQTAYFVEHGIEVLKSGVGYFWKCGGVLIHEYSFRSKKEALSTGEDWLEGRVEITNLANAHNTFAAKCFEKLNEKQESGVRGWDDPHKTTASDLVTDIFDACMEKRWVAVANYAMFLHHRESSMENSDYETVLPQPDGGE